MEVRQYISPFVLKHESREDKTRREVNAVMVSNDYYDSWQYVHVRAEDKARDFNDLHLQWTREREKYAKGDDEALARMLDFVTDTNPPSKTPAQVAAIKARSKSEQRAKTTRKQRRRAKYPEGFWRAFWKSPIGDPRFQMHWPAIFRRRG
jgi:hypothetical protein